MLPIVFVLFFIFLVLAIPIAYGLMIAGGTAVFLVDRYPVQIIAQRIFSPTQSELLLAIPFFIVAGELLTSGKLGERLISFATHLVGRFIGGLGQVSVLTSMVFAGVSGSAVADASGIGSVLIPWQKREGYPAPFAAALNASSATLGVIIPPSIPMIIYAAVSGASVGALFLAGLLPGLILGIGLLLVCRVVAGRGNFPRHREIASWGTLAKEFVLTIPALVMPAFVLGAIIFGIATPTEVSVLAALYALLVSALLYRDLTIRRLWSAMVRAGVITGSVMLIIMASALIGWILTVELVPQQLTEWFIGTGGAYPLAIAFMIIVMLVVGTFLDMPAAILILTPVFVPLAEVIGLDIIQLGVIMTLALAMGLFTPPVGTTLFVSTQIAKIKIEETVRALVPFYIVAFIVLLLVSYVPALTITP